MSTTLDIKIQGREYRVACPPEEVESLQSAAELLNTRLDEIAKATKSTGERLAIMTALNLAHEVDAGKTEAIPQSHTASASENSIATPIDDAESLRRIEAIEARLDAALARQNELF
ncbi:MAG: cell division protein ZapA [Rhodocyclaceae bacterium]|nr:cell division protein ZapA [Rhodocyclaceae bacterium]MDZ4214394.1 cell division protein ZapA [Rhodocyclaceae bacterium]